MSTEQHHTIIWTLGRYGRLDGLPRCSAPVGSDCRLTNDSCQCEEWDAIHRDDQNRPYHEVENGDGEMDRHYMHDQGECNVVLFLDESDIEECGPGHDVVLATMPIELVWDDGYLWKPAS